MFWWVGVPVSPERDLNIKRNTSLTNMRLNPIFMNKSSQSTGNVGIRVPYKSYWHIPQIFQVVNNILSHRDSFSFVFGPIFALFCQSTSQVPDIEELFNQSQAVGDITVDILQHYMKTDPMVTNTYIYNTIMDCQAAQRLIRINNHYLTQDFDGIVGSSCKFLFLVTGLLHEVCHVLTRPMNMVSGNGHSNVWETPPNIGKMVYPDGIMRPDCGYGWELALFGGALMQVEQTYSALALHHILDFEQPAAGTNIQRIPVPENLIVNFYHELKSWSDDLSRSFFSSLLRCECSRRPTPFPHQVFEELHYLHYVDRVQPLPLPTDAIAIRLDETQFTKLRAIIGGNTDRWRDEVPEVGFRTRPDDSNTRR